MCNGEEDCEEVMHWTSLRRGAGQVLVPNRVHKSLQVRGAHATAPAMLSVTHRMRSTTSALMPLVAGPFRWGPNAATERSTRPSDGSIRYPAVPERGLRTGGSWTGPGVEKDLLALERHGSAESTGREEPRSLRFAQIVRRAISVSLVRWIWPSRGNWRG